MLHNGPQVKFILINLNAYNLIYKFYEDQSESLFR